MTSWIKCTIEDGTERRILGHRVREDIQATDEHRRRGVDRGDDNRREQQVRLHRCPRPRSPRSQGDRMTTRAGKLAQSTLRPLSGSCWERIKHSATACL